MTDPFVGQLSFIRVYSGTMKTGDSVLNTTKGTARAHRPPPQDARQQARGDQGGLRRRHRGRGGPEERHHRRHHLRSRTSRWCSSRSASPPPSSPSRWSPRPRATRRSSGAGLAKLMQEDPTFKVETDKDTGQTKISGMGELHLEILVDRLKREFSVEANVGKPQVAYKETIRKASKAEGRYIKQTGGHGQYGALQDRALPRARRGLRLRERHHGRRPSPRSSSSPSRPASGRPPNAASSPATPWWT